MNYFLQAPFNTNELNITIIGCGGTGSFAAESICRLLTGTDYQLHLIDPDNVESRNTLRQNFYPSEIGLNKAEALARRLARNFGVPISYSPSRLTTSCHSQQYLYSYNHDTDCPVPDGVQILLACVDNAAARLAVEAHAVAHYSGWNIDAGNDDKYGQILIGNSKDPGSIIASFQGDSCQRLPMPSLQRPDLVQNQLPPRANRDMDCARAIELQEQSPTINQMMATLATDTLLKLLTQRCNYMSLYVDMESSNMTTVPANPHEAKRVLTANDLHPDPQKETPTRMQTDLEQDGEDN